MTRIDPKIQAQNRSGVTGKLLFDKTNLSANPTVYNEVRKLMQGEQGLGGSGGERANLLRGPASISQSNVFTNAKDRNAVQSRLENQFTIGLQQRYGEVAEKQKMSIPDYLQSQGVGGIKEVGEGADKRMTAFSRENFVKHSMNPLTSSNEKMTNAYLRQTGAQTVISGGQNEHRRNTSFLTKKQAEYADDNVRKVAVDLENGLDNKSPLAGVFGTQTEREHISTRRKTVQNALATGELDEPGAPSNEKIRSGLLLKQRQKDALAVAEEELRASGEIDPDIEKEPRSIEDSRSKLLFKDQESKNTVIAKQQLEDEGFLEPKEKKEPRSIEDSRSKLLFKDQESKNTAIAKQQLEDEGFLEPKEKKEDKSGSGKGNVAKGAAAIVSAIGSTVKKIATTVSNMIGWLKKISVDLGRMASDSAEVGIDSELADRMRRWGIANPTYAQGNDHLLMDALKVQQAKFGDVTRLEGSTSGFKSAGYHQYEKLFKPVIEGAIDQNPLDAMQKIFGLLATRMQNTHGDKAKRQELKTQNSVLTDMFSSTYAHAYTAMYQATEAKELLTPSNAKNIFTIATHADRVDKLETTGLHLNTLTGAAADSSGIKGKTARLNDVLGDLGKIQNALYMMLLSYMDIIVKALLALTGAIVRMWGSAEQKEQVKETEKRMAVQGYGNLNLNTEKYRLEAESRVRAKLEDKGYHGSALTNKTNEVMTKLVKGEALSRSDRYITSGGSGAKAVHAAAAYAHGQKVLDRIYNNKEKGIFDTSGDIFDMLEQSDWRKRRETYGVRGHEPSYKWTQSVKKKYVKDSTLSELRADTAGTNAVTTPRRYEKTLIWGWLPYTDTIPAGKKRGDSKVNNRYTEGVNSGENDYQSPFVQGVDDIARQNYLPRRTSELSSEIVAALSTAGSMRNSLSSPPTLENLGASVGGASSDPLVITHNVVISNNGKVISQSSENFDISQRKNSYFKSSNVTSYDS